MAAGSSKSACSSDFSKWVIENGGNEQMLDFLATRGFTSKLSLQYLDLESEDGQLLLRDLSIGQKCLLRGLVKLCAGTGSKGMSMASTSSAYSSLADKARAVGAKGKQDSTLKEKLNKLFSFGDSSSSKKIKIEDKVSEDDDFQPEIKGFRASLKGKGKGKFRSGPRVVKGSGKKKIKEVRFRVVSVCPDASSTPVNCGDKAKEFWIRADASDTDLQQHIKDRFEWPEKQQFKYLYAQGKCLREAKLADIMNATSWDCETVKALMGNGYLYVSKNVVEKSKELEKKASDLSTLRDMFPDTPEDELEDALGSSTGLGEAVDFLIESLGDMDEAHAHSRKMNLTTQGSSKQNPIALEEPMSGEEVIAARSKEVISSSMEHLLDIDRTDKDKLWGATIRFYKKAKEDKGRLVKQLVVHFSGEPGIDSGSLRREFFEDALKEANARLFAGKDERRIPKKDWSLESLFEIFGMLLSHSLLQGGPGFSCLSPAVFNYLVSGSSMYCFPVQEDIPLDISTHTLISFIEKVEAADSCDALDSALDEPPNICIVNSSSWNVVKAVTVDNKASLVQQLIDEEVIIKRERNLQAFRYGLETLGLLQLLTKYPSLMRPYFVMESNPLTPAKFLSLVKYCFPKTSAEIQAFEFFKEFVTALHEDPASDGVSLGDVLRFATGVATVPPLGFEDGIKIGFLQNASMYSLPTAQACFCRLNLPVVHESYSSFHAAFMIALNFGGAYGSS